MNLQSLLDKLALVAFGMTQREAWSKGICIECKQPALSKCHTGIGCNEYRISAICEECFDAWRERRDPACKSVIPARSTIQ